MNHNKEWQQFLRRLQSEFSVQSYSVYSGDGCNMQLQLGESLPQYLIEEYLSYHCTTVTADVTGSRMITRLSVGGTILLIVLHSKYQSGLTENEARYILNDMNALIESLGKEDKA